MRKFKVVGIIASSVAAIGLTALAATSANASDGGEDAERERTTSGQTESGPTQPGEGDIELGAGVSVKKNEDGSMEIVQLTEEEAEEMDGWQPVTPPAE
ncbi:hypothetical protein SAMN06297387_106120 [Streptomyces zhaozhouensis]|uniref:Secreted protein n=1 Tax=Streptomyces zhaozhouensis TaxID=1300267 RepID=A0A286DVA4_9ACTN|nr:hypothetical protein [Streptomyces zhaozhouensis]SOD62543.1 hypothetical protein SAMN06297387_106120 [Streptomyces zhaozhouensis]